MALRHSTSVLLLGVVSCAAPTRSLRNFDARGANAPTAPTKPKVTPADAEVFRVELERLVAEIEAVRSLRFVGMDDGPVPAFDLESVDGVRYESSVLVGHRPFVVAFFATWCEACGRKLRSLRSALDEAGSMLVIPVSCDRPENFNAVERYLQAHGFVEPAVFAAHYPLMALSYGPFDTIPLLVIVGRNGGLVDYQLGYEVEHERRLASSLRLAHVIAPLAKPAMSRTPVAD